MTSKVIFRKLPTPPIYNKITNNRQQDENDLASTTMRGLKRGLMQFSGL